jgi:hypothetical protein
MKESQTEETALSDNHCSNLADILECSKIFIEPLPQPSVQDHYAMFLAQKNSLIELLKYEHYLSYKLRRSTLVKRVLLKIINYFQGLSGELAIKDKEIKLFVFLLNTIEYLNSQALIKTFDLAQHNPEEKHKILLAKDAIDLSKLTSCHR